MRMFGGCLKSSTPVLLALLCAGPAAAVEQWDMEIGHYSEYGWSPSGTAPTMSQQGDPACSGSKSIRVDLSYSTSPTPFRAELTNVDIAGKKFMEWGKEYWLSMSYYVPESWQWDEPSRGDIFFQLQQDPDDGEQWRNPPLAFRISGDRWVVEYKADANAITPFGQYQVNGIKDLGPVARGEWTHVVFNLKTSYRSDGFLNVWINGQQQLAYAGPILFNDVNGPYVKMGIYKPYWKNRDNWGGASAFDSRQLFIDDIKAVVGSGQLSAVSNSCVAVVSPPTAPPAFSVE